MHLEWILKKTNIGANMPPICMWVVFFERFEDLIMKWIYIYMLLFHVIFNIELIDILKLIISS